MTTEIAEFIETLRKKYNITLEDISTLNELLRPHIFLTKETLNTIEILTKNKFINC